MKYEEFLLTNPELTYENALKARSLRLQENGGRERFLDYYCTSMMLDDLTEEEKIKLVTVDPMMVRTINRTSKDVLKAAISAMPYIIVLLEYIQDREELLKFALQKDPTIFKMLSDSDKRNTIKYVIQSFPDAILYYKYPGKEILAEAIKIKPELIKYFPDNKELAEIAFSYDATILAYITPGILPRNESTSLDDAYITKLRSRLYEDDDILTFANWELKYNPENIFKIPNPTDEQYKKAFKAKPMLLRFFLNKVSAEIILYTLSEDGAMIRWIPNPTHEMKMTAVANCSFAIASIPDADDEIMDRALLNHLEAIEHMGHLKVPETLIELACSNKDNAYHIQNFPDISEALMLKLLNKNPEIFQWFANPTKKVCVEAIKLRADNVKWINPEMFKGE